MRAGNTQRPAGSLRHAWFTGSLGQRGEQVGAGSGPAKSGATRTAGSTAVDRDSTTRATATPPRNPTNQTVFTLWCPTSGAVPTCPYSLSPGNRAAWAAPDFTVPAISCCSWLMTWSLKLMGNLSPDVRVGPDGPVTMDGRCQDPDSTTPAASAISRGLTSTVPVPIESPAVSAWPPAFLMLPMNADR